MLKIDGHFICYRVESLAAQLLAKTSESEVLTQPYTAKACSGRTEWPRRIIANQSSSNFGFLILESRTWNQDIRCHRHRLFPAFELVQNSLLRRPPESRSTLRVSTLESQSKHPIESRRCIDVTRGIKNGSIIDNQR